tara:strand:+ start:2408 stop:2650 length:243 start_codon:yes stop_codon:yes gene_type:complete
MIVMKFVTIYNKDTGEKVVLKSGDRETWQKLTEEEKYWVRYLSKVENQELYSSVAKIERTLNTNRRKYLPVYVRIKKDDS